MAFRPPSADEVAGVARSLGFTLTPEETELFTRHVGERLEAIDGFVRADLPESAPPVTFPDRDPGHRPEPGEDPLRAWLWKCEIRGAPDGLLVGRTVSFKDHVAVAGIPLSFGVASLADFVPDVDATIVTRVLEAGATIVGKNTLDGFSGMSSLGLHGEDRRPLNPHDPGHVTGGSSSGSAVAVAAGEVDVAFGGDQGGSIRIPASWCGVVALKPSFGLVSHFGIGWERADQSVDYTGPMARRVEDVAAGLQAVAGYDGLDPRQGRDVPDRIDVLSGLDGGVDGLRVGLLQEGFQAPIQTEVADAVEVAAEVLAAAGAEVHSVSVPEHRQTDYFFPLVVEGGRAIMQTGLFGAFARTYYPTSLVVAHNRRWRDDVDALAPQTKVHWIAAELSRRLHDGAAYAKAHNVRGAFVEAYDGALAEVDVLLMPTTVTVAPKHRPAREGVSAAELELSILEGARGAHDELPALELMVVNTLQFNYTGHPALTVPCGKAGGLPIGFQLVGRRLEDGLLLRAAYAYQQSVGPTGLREPWRRG